VIRRSYDRMKPMPHMAMLAAIRRARHAGVPTAAKEAKSSHRSPIFLRTAGSARTHFLVHDT